MWEPNMAIRAALVILVLAGSGQVAEAADVQGALVRQFNRLERQPGLGLPALGNSAHRQLDCDPAHRASCAGTYWAAIRRALSVRRFGL
jgi:hypothetical protein